MAAAEIKKRPRVEEMTEGPNVKGFEIIQDESVITMKIFDVIKHLLIRSGYQFEELKQAIRVLNRNYTFEQLGMNGDINDFTHEKNRYGYLYRNMISHITNVRMNYLDNDPRSAERSMTNTLPGSINICSIGGGPATDAIAFGILWSHNRPDRKFKFQYTSLDNIGQWQQLWEPLYIGCEMCGLIREGLTDLKQWRHVPYDFWSSNALSSDAKEAISKANLITMVNFLSSVAYKGLGNEAKQVELEVVKNAPKKAESEQAAAVEERKTVCAKKIVEILDQMKPGAFMFYIDNDTDQGTGNDKWGFTNIMARACKLDFYGYYAHWYHNYEAEGFLAGVDEWQSAGWAIWNENDRPLSSIDTRCLIYQKK